MRKPAPADAMRQLLDQARTIIPFDIPPEQLCDGPCRGCPKKLLEYLDSELGDWEERLQHGETPRLGDVEKLARLCRKVYAALERNDIV